MSSFDFSEFSLGCVEPLGLISLITWEQSSLKYMRDDIDLPESFEGEEGATTTFPLIGAWWALVFNLFLAWKNYTGEWVRETWTI
jgi:hypothetical protein